MSGLTFREYEPHDEEGYYRVRSLTYNDGLPIPPEHRSEFKYGTRYVAIQDGEVAGAFNALHMTATRGKALLTCAGVAGVAVSPHTRRSGIGLKMMQWSVAQFRSEGFHLASLYPFRETFYSRAGYAVAGKRFEISVPVHRLPKIDSDLTVRLLGPDDWQEIAVCYDAFGYARSGVTIRNELLWGRRLNENRPLTIYAAGDPIEGYVAISHKVNFWEGQSLSEVVWSTSRGYEACLGIMHQIGINKTSLNWYEPSDSPYYAEYLDQGVEVGVVRPIMFRVCDVPKSLEKLQPSGAGSFSIRVSDPQIPENEGPWRVEWESGMVSVSPANDADLEMEIGPFSQAFLGEPSLADLARYGSVLVRSERGLAAAEQLLPPSPTYCGDFF
ncbi:MAG TPA: GNAT family N-acetyltransferase [Fimbriimonas sp.]|nr:GNAT family N-acetyltransferase [Fimbriimonas sp.]